MKNGISAWAFPDTTPLKEVFKTAKEYGFEGVELALAETGELSLSTTEKELDIIKSAAKDAGIELYSIASGLYWSYPFSSLNPDVRAKALEIAKKQIDIAAYLGCDTVLVIPGQVGENTMSYGDTYAHALEISKELGDYAAAKKVYVGLENVWNNFLMTPTDMNSFIEAVGKEYVGAYFDVGNVLITGYPQDWIRILGSKIKKVHFKDFKCSSRDFVDILAGDVDYGEVLKAFDEIGYTGWATAEVFPYKSNNDVMLAHTSIAMKKILKK